MSLKPVQQTNAETGETKIIMREMPDSYAEPTPKPIDLEKLVTALIARGQLMNRKQVEVDVD